MNATTNAKVGDRVLYVAKYGTAPTETKVTKVTKAGWINVELRPSVAFKPNDRCYEMTGRLINRGTVYPFSEERLAELTAKHEEVEKANAERRAENDRREREYRERVARELEEVRAAFGGNWINGLRFRDAKPGCRIYVIDLPVKPEMAERKGGWETMIVRCRDVVDDDWDVGRGDVVKVRRVEVHATYTNGGSYSFPSCSGSKFDSDDAAIWEAARSQYHNWS